MKYDAMRFILRVTLPQFPLPPLVDFRDRLI